MAAIVRITFENLYVINGTQLANEDSLKGRGEERRCEDENSGAIQHMNN